MALDVTPAEDGRGRLDHALVAAAAAEGLELTRGQLARAFEAGRVTDEDGGRLKPSLRFKRPMRVQVRPVPAAPLRATPQDLPLTVLHEDADLLVIDKAAGMPVHPGPGHADGTVVNAVLHHLGVEAEGLPVLEGNDAVRPGIVHRLDKDTSGVMVVARTEAAQRGLAQAFRTHDIERAYRGIVSGVVAFSSRTIVSGHGRDRADRRRFAPVARGPGVRDAITHLKVERRLRGATLMRFVLETGRTHQIRMHARGLGHPILGDALYGYRPRTEDMGDIIRAMGRQALHAGVLGFTHPVSGAAMRFEASLPAAIQRALDALSPSPAAGPSSE